jgi:prevent-host-death family protein
MYSISYYGVMKTVNALKLRQQLGSVLKELQASGRPVLIERNSRPAAVLISLEDYQKRFVDREADDKRREMIEVILKTRLRLPAGKSTLDLLQEGRP